MRRVPDLGPSFSVHCASCNAELHLGNETNGSAHAAPELQDQDRQDLEQAPRQGQVEGVPGVPWNSEGGENPEGPQVEAEFRTHGRPLAWIKFKEFPSCHCTHASLRAARLLHNQTAGRPIRDVGVVVSDYALSQTSIRSPQTPDQAKFSQSFAVAAMLQRGTAGVDAFAVDALEDEGIRSLERRTTVGSQAGLAELEAHVVVFLEDGARLEAREFIDLDDCSEPPDFVRTKFRRNVEAWSDSADAEAILSMIDEPVAWRVAELLPLLAPETG